MQDPESRRLHREQWKAAGYSREDIRLMERLLEPDLPGHRPGKRGRETKWTGELLSRLLREVLELTGGKTRKVSAACRTLANREPWRTLVETSGTKRQPADVLRERYVRLFMGCIEIWKHVKTGEEFERIRPKHPKRGGKHR